MLFQQLSVFYRIQRTNLISDWNVGKGEMPNSADLSSVPFSTTWFLIYVEKTPMARTVIVLLPGISHWNQSKPNSTRLYLVLLTNGPVNSSMGTGVGLKLKRTQNSLLMTWQHLLTNMVAYKLSFYCFQAGENKPKLLSSKEGRNSMPREDIKELFFSIRILVSQCPRVWKRSHDHNHRNMREKQKSAVVNTGCTTIKNKLFIDKKIFCNYQCKVISPQSTHLLIWATLLCETLWTFILLPRYNTKSFFMLHGFLRHEINRSAACNIDDIFEFFSHSALLTNVLKPMKLE